MAYEFQKLGEVEILTEVPEGASVIAEVDGDIKRVPSTGLGGGGSDSKTLIIVTPEFAVAKTTPNFDDPAWEELWNSLDTAEAYFGAISTNMSFEDTIAAFRNCEEINIILYTYAPVRDLNGNEYCGARSLKCDIVDYSNICTCDCLCIAPCNIDFDGLIWTANGFAPDYPFKEAPAPLPPT